MFECHLLGFQKQFNPNAFFYVVVRKKAFNNKLFIQFKQCGSKIT